jgi:hypothetical protein
MQEGVETVRPSAPERPLLPTALRWIAAGSYLIIFSVGLFLSLQTPIRPTPLVSVDGWRTDGFNRLTGLPKHPAISRDILDDSEAIFWQAGPNLDGRIENRIRTDPFDAPPRLVIPYRIRLVRGNWDVHANLYKWISSFLECVDSGRRLPIRARETNVQFSELHVRIPSSFCRGPVALEIVSQENVDVTIGTPFGFSTPNNAWKSSAFVHTYHHGLAFLLILVVGLAPCLILRGVLPAVSPGVVFLSSVGLVGYASFFLFDATPVVGRLLSGLAIALSGAVVVTSYLRKRSVFLEVRGALAGGVTAWFLASWFYVLLLYSVDSGAGSWQANSRFLPVWWSSDNNWPMTVSETIYNQDSLRGLFGKWNVSDRPPIQAGVALFFRPFSFAFLPQHPHLIALYHHTIGVVLNSLWIFACQNLCSRMGLRGIHTAAVLAALVFAPLTLFNSLYVWPKLLATAFALMVFKLLAADVFGRADAQRPPLSNLVCALILSALSLLTHGINLFFLVVIWIWRLVRGPAIDVRSILLCAGLAAALMGPWMVWQKVVDPPGNAVLKQALAGDTGFDQKDVGLLEAVVRGYSKLSLADWVDRKAKGVRMLAVGVGRPDEAWNWFERQRMRQFLFVFPSIGLCWLLVIGVVMNRKPRRWAPMASSGAYDWCRALIQLGFLAIVLHWLLIWGPHILPHQGYANVLSILLGGIAGSLFVFGRAAAILIGLGVLGSAAIWVGEPILHGTDRDALAVLLCSSMILGSVYLLAAIRPPSSDG